MLCLIFAFIFVYLLNHVLELQFSLGGIIRIQVMLNASTASALLSLSRELINSRINARAVGMSTHASGLFHLIRRTKKATNQNRSSNEPNPILYFNSFSEFTWLFSASWCRGTFWRKELGDAGTFFLASHVFPPPFTFFFNIH